MARGQHRFRNRRLRGVRSNNIAVHAANAPVKRKQTDRRDTRLKGMVKAQLAAGKPLSAAAQSWVSIKAGRPFTKLTAEQVAATVA